MEPTGKKARSSEEILKPSSVIEYCKAKKGVDKSDQMSMYHTTRRKKRKWYQKLAIELIPGMAVVNAWVLYNKFLNDKTTSMKEFNENLIEKLV